MHDFSNFQKEEYMLQENLFKVSNWSELSVDDKVRAINMMRDGKYRNNLTDNINELLESELKNKIELDIENMEIELNDQYGVDANIHFNGNMYDVQVAFETNYVDVYKLLKEFNYKDMFNHDSYREHLYFNHDSFMEDVENYLNRIEVITTLDINLNMSVKLHNYNIEDDYLDDVFDNEEMAIFIEEWMNEYCQEMSHRMNRHSDMDDLNQIGLYNSTLNEFMHLGFDFIFCHNDERIDLIEISIKC